MGSPTITVRASHACRGVRLVPWSARGVVRFSRVVTIPSGSGPASLSCCGRGPVAVLGRAGITASWRPTAATRHPQLSCGETPWSSPGWVASRSARRAADALLAPIALIGQDNKRAVTPFAQVQAACISLDNGEILARCPRVVCSIGERGPIMSLRARVLDRNRRSATGQPH